MAERKTEDSTDSLELSARNGDSLASFATAIRRLHGAELWTVSPATGGAAQLVILPKDKRVEDLGPILEKYLPYPKRRVGSAALTDLDSLLAHVERFKTGATAIFADPTRTKPSLTVVYDYHPSEEDADGEKVANADWLQHRATYAPALSDAWVAWHKHNGQLMQQGDFADFIELHIGDLMVAKLDDPNLKTFADLLGGRFAEPSELVGLARGLQVNVEMTVRNAVNTNNGTIQVQFAENQTTTNAAGAAIDVPNLFQIALPVFYNDAKYVMGVRLRYKRNGGSLLWSYSLITPELVFDYAFKEITTKVRAETQLPVFLGTPEK